MAFPEDYLHPNEELILDLKPHWFRLVLPAGALVVALLVGLVVVLNEVHAVVNLAVGVLLIAAVAWFGVEYARWVSTHFVLTSDRVIHRSGIISREGIEIPLERINTVFSSQSVFERMIGAGDLVIESASTEGRQEFNDMRKPGSIQNEIYVAMEENENRKFDRIGRGGAPAPAAAPSIAEQIEQLDSLRQRGLISEEEFTRKKSELLDRM
ncbi:PH domain-containing protein [Actinomarinicola tropica]|uniref:PH domain-containing protein n=1 Tax=Actinomarinicola tropica TaxID=2789776 RepID=A0A5Q2RD78_9ACTN|nr:PH domain-containing protein [Actinomarinicola tropica]QGG94808.1 PH domain-containing protein [Actinomarinicola tropica]